MDILVMGESGTGKSTSIQKLSPEETFVLQITKKELPFANSRKKYPLKTREKEGNRYVCDSVPGICKIIKGVNADPKIKNLVIDDFYYIMSNQYMECLKEEQLLDEMEQKVNRYQKFSTIGLAVWLIIKCSKDIRSDLDVILLTHSDVDERGRAKVKTIGKMVDNIVNIEGEHTIVLNSKIIDEKFVFQTTSDSTSKAKSPTGMFEKYIDNDLQFVIDSINKYYNNEEK